MPVKALILTGYGLNCDYETEYALKLAGAKTLKMHINDVIENSGKILEDCQILVFGGGFSWADDHGAGVIFASKIKYNIGDRINEFIEEGNLVIGICNGFQSLVNPSLCCYLTGSVPNGADRSWLQAPLSLPPSSSYNAPLSKI